MDKLSPRLKAYFLEIGILSNQVKHTGKPCQTPMVHGNVEFVFASTYVRFKQLEIKIRNLENVELVFACRRRDVTKLISKLEITMSKGNYAYCLSTILFCNHCRHLLQKRYIHNPFEYYYWIASEISTINYQNIWEQITVICVSRICITLIIVLLQASWLLSLVA